MEEREPNATSVAKKLLSNYEHRFSGMQYTLHPCGLEGEAPGKSSNIGWAARGVQHKYSGKPGWKDKLVTVMDSKAAPRRAPSRLTDSRRHASSQQLLQPGDPRPYSKPKTE